MSRAERGHAREDGRMILVIGGTGGFGARICRQLHAEGHVVVAAARNEARGERFARRNPGIRYVHFDRDHVTASDLASYDVVVDAAGPFRDQSRRLQRAAIQARTHCIDIADDRAYVTGVVDLDHEARRQGVCVVSGASSVPALSGAVAKRLTADMDRVDLVQIAITASSRAAFGRSVLHSMLSSAGRPIRRVDGSVGTAMASPRPLRIAHQGRRPLSRTVLEVDAPDQDLVPQTLPGQPAVRFHAGGELGMHNLAMRLVAWAVGRGWLRDGASLVAPARAVRHLTSWTGSGRSGMEVRVTGIVDGVRHSRFWSLVAAKNMGPLIPALTVPAIVQSLAADRIQPGAMTALGLCEVDDILGRMPRASITQEIVEDPATPLYARAMPDLARVAPVVRAMHDVPSVTYAEGRATVMRGTSLLARVVAWTFGFPPAADDLPVSVTFEPYGNGERWTRDFGGNRFSSVLSPVEGGVEERFGPFSFAFRLEERAGALAMVPTRWRMGKLPLPRWLMPNGTAVERDGDGRFTFDVPIVLPLVGEVVHYRGWLVPVAR